MDRVHAQPSTAYHCLLLYHCLRHDVGRQCGRIIFRHKQPTRYCRRTIHIHGTGLYPVIHLHATGSCHQESHRQEEHVLCIPLHSHHWYGIPLYSSQDAEPQHDSGIYSPVCQVHRCHRRHRIYVGSRARGNILWRVYQRQAYCRHRQCSDRHLL